ncbi:hypothetical protein C0993_009164 [Termitomyces sp. T159_Od127]|nr:hypothetical protein C0993_009164 [Termitomyces sp. T159_Od127]
MRDLPARVVWKRYAMRQADLLLIIGTSLVVQPFASLAGLTKNSCRRVLINLERAGDIGRRPTDIVLLGECDATIRELCAALGWSEELEKAWSETTVMTPLAAAAVKGEGQGKEGEEEETETLAGEVADEVADEVNEIAGGMGKQLDLVEGQKQATAD